MTTTSSPSLPTSTMARRSSHGVGLQWMSEVDPAGKGAANRCVAAAGAASISVMRTVIAASLPPTTPMVPRRVRRVSVGCVSDASLEARLGDPGLELVEAEGVDGAQRAGAVQPALGGALRAPGEDA